MLPDNAMIEERLANFRDRCRKEGVKLTPQRLEIFRTLAATDRHPDAEALYRQIVERLPHVSTDTVYRTLALFERLGLAARVDAHGASAHFDADTREHQHFVCDQCGAIKDLYLNNLRALVPEEQLQELGAISGLALVLRGICHECLAREN